MKLKLAATAATALLALTACAVPEDDGTTAADRAEVNNPDAETEGSSGKGGEDGGTDKPKETPGQENARESAANYLDIAPYSRTGLIKQLKFEGYSEKDATYGVDAQKADYNKQAALAAQNYLDISPFSRDGLIKQLKFEGYTQKQAEAGVKAAGL